MMGEEKIKRMVDKANKLSERGHNTAALQLLREMWDQAVCLPEGRAKSLRGLIYHYQGRVEQAMGQYKDAVMSLELALGYRQYSSIDYADTMFQLFICKIYGKLPITDEEVEETKIALTAVMAKTASIADIINTMQNLAYVEQVRGSVKKAISLYEMVLGARRKAKDQQAIALVFLRLAECYKANGQSYEARDSASFARGYFLSIDDEERLEEAKKVLREIKR